MPPRRSTRGGGTDAKADAKAAEEEKAKAAKEEKAKAAKEKKAKAARAIGRRREEPADSKAPSAQEEIAAFLAEHIARATSPR